MHIASRTALAAIATSMLSPIFGAIFYFATGGGKDMWSVFIPLAAWLVAIFHIAIIGIPIFFILRHKHYLSWLSLAVAGFLAGFIPIAALTWPIHGYETLQGYLGGSVIFGLFGLVSALFFWRTWEALGA